MKDLDNGEWLCYKCKKVWKENNYNVITLCNSCTTKRVYLLKSKGEIR